MSKFKVGQKVVCVDKSQVEYFLVEGQIYEVAGVFDDGLSVKGVDVTFDKTRFKHLSKPKKKLKKELKALKAEKQELQNKVTLNEHQVNALLEVVNACQGSVRLKAFQKLKDAEITHFQNLAQTEKETD